MKLIFDFDGTLHKSECTYIPAFQSVRSFMERHGWQPACEMSDDEIGYWLGYSSKEMWARYAPDLTPEQRAACAKVLSDEMLERARQGKAQLYPGARTALETLKAEGHTLVFFSNCHHDYMTVHSEAFGLNAYFDAFFCGEDYGWKTKAETFANIRARLGTTDGPAREFVVIGDRFHDIDIARVHGLVAVGCAYGYGTRDELAGAQVIVKDPEHLLEGVEQAVQLAANR